MTHMPAGAMEVAIASADALETEALRLHSKLQALDWTLDVCRTYAPFTLEINELKKQKNAVILAHSYMTPDIIYGVADFTGDSLGLALEAQKTTAEIIVLAGVQFMAETAKVLNPEKTVLLPSIEAGCSLSESITFQDVRDLKAKYPQAGVVTYVNTNADVKAESDACCTSANALQIINAMPQQQVIFLPDEFMAKNLAKLTKKEIISWHGKCVVHKEFDGKKIAQLRDAEPGLKILVHQECPPAVVEAADYVGGTTGMLDYVKNTSAEKFVVVTECGLGDRIRVEMPEKQVVGACGLCPYMKKNNLQNILQVLKTPAPNQIIEIEPGVQRGARNAILKMLELGKKSD